MTTKHDFIHGAFHLKDICMIKIHRDKPN